MYPPAPDRLNARVVPSFVSKSEAEMTKGTAVPAASSSFKVTSTVVKVKVGSLSFLSTTFIVMTTEADSELLSVALDLVKIKSLVSLT